MTKITREPTGIKGIDLMTKGGFPKGSIIGISGSPGAGKSILSLHFTLEGAKRGEKSVYINLEEPRWNIDNMLLEFEFGEEFLKLEREGLIIVKCLNYDKYEKIQEDLFERIKNDKEIKRLVIDSFNCFFAATSKPGQFDVSIRKAIVEIFYNLRRRNLTTLLTLEKENISNYNIPYLVDGIISLDFLDLGTIERRIFIPKMRWTEQYKEGKFYDINKTGISIKENEWKN